MPIIQLLSRCSWRRPGLVVSAVGRSCDLKPREINKTPVTDIQTLIKIYAVFATDDKANETQVGPKEKSTLDSIQTFE